MSILRSLKWTNCLVVAALITLNGIYAEAGDLPVATVTQMPAPGDTFDTNVGPALKAGIELADKDLPMPKELWGYLRRGLNYLESSGRDYSPRFLHPGGVAFGSLAMTRIAIKDVIIHCDAFSGYTVDDVLSDRILYEKCALYFADLLLRHYFKLKYWQMDKREVFEILQRAWFLGPGLYKKGLAIPLSRAKNASLFVKSTT